MKNIEQELKKKAAMYKYSDIETLNKIMESDTD
jgi:hypothetical protein